VQRPSQPVTQMTASANLYRSFLKIKRSFRVTSTGHPDDRPPVTYTSNSPDADPILDAIHHALLAATGKTLDYRWCAKVRDTISDVPKPASYYVTAIRRDPERFAPTSQPPRFSAQANR
jgi:hypothetical protein